jgi:hypothetical protein
VLTQSNFPGRLCKPVLGGSLLTRWTVCDTGLRSVKSMLSLAHSNRKGTMSNPPQLLVYWVLLVKNLCKMQDKVVALFYVYAKGIASLCTPLGLVGVN